MHPLFPLLLGFKALSMWTVCRVLTASTMEASNRFGRGSVQKEAAEKVLWICVWQAFDSDSEV